MTMGAIGERRYRIALHDTSSSFGAGGRPIKTSPHIADVWAAMEDTESSLTEQGDRQKTISSTSFVTEFAPEYMYTKSIIMGQNRYRVISVRKAGTLRPIIHFSVRALPE